MQTILQTTHFFSQYETITLFFYLNEHSFSINKDTKTNYTSILYIYFVLFVTKKQIQFI